MKKNKRQTSLKWALRLLLWSFAITIVLTLFSSHALSGARLFTAILVLSLFVMLNVFFDMLGIAAATAPEKPFHSMAARQVNGAKESIRIVKNAEKVSSFCCDMVGDICGIVSGISSATIVNVLTRDFSISLTVTTLVVSGILAGFTVGGKALFKSVAMHHNTQIVFAAGRVIYAIKRIVK